MAPASSSGGSPAPAPAPTPAPAHSQNILDGTVDCVHLLVPIAWYLRWDVLPFFLAYGALFGALLTADLQALGSTFAGASAGAER